MTHELEKMNQHEMNTLKWKNKQKLNFINIQFSSDDETNILNKEIIFPLKRWRFGNGSIFNDFRRERNFIFIIYCFELKNKKETSQFSPAVHGNVATFSMFTFDNEPIKFK